MSKKVFFSVVVGLSVVGSMVFADAEQTAGGWGQNCDSGNVPCYSGRTISCNSTAADDARSVCTQHTGDEGWVSCTVYDRDGNVLDQAKDACP